MSDTCHDCGHRLPDRSPTSPEVRRCQDDYWREQRRRFARGEDVDEFCLGYFRRALIEKPKHWPDEWVAELRGVS